MKTEKGTMVSLYKNGTDRMLPSINGLLKNSMNVNVFFSGISLVKGTAIRAMLLHIYSNYIN